MTPHKENSEEFDLVITPESVDRQYWKDIWRHRDLFFFLAWRDLLVRYKQTAIGIAWSVIRPLLTMIVFTIVFGKIAKLPSEGAPYPILVFAAMLPWQFFSMTLTEASGSLIGNANLLSKVYFPRLIVPASSIIVNLVDFLISFAIFIGMMIWYRYTPGWQILTLPFFMIAVAFLSFGLGTYLGALNVKYRDFRYVVPFIVQLGLYISPVGFSSNLVPEKWRLLYSLNPMVGMIDGFRWAILGQTVDGNWPGIALSVAMSFCLFLFGITYFRKTEKTFADVI